MTSSRTPSLPPHLSDPGFEIGWDFAHYRLVPPAEHLLAGNPVRDGWEAGQAVFGARTLRATPHVRKWLQLRLGAWMRGKAFELMQVTPGFLERIEVASCPITGRPLTHGAGSDSDASVDRVNNQAGYAAGNLAVMSVRANQAKSDYGWRDCAAFARQVEAGRLDAIDGLDARQWARLAALTSLCTPMGHREAATMPLLVLPPPRLRLLNPVQALQALLTLAFARPGVPPRQARLLGAFPRSLRPHVQSLFTSLVAYRRAAGFRPTAQALRQAMENAWAEPALLALWRRVSLRLDGDACEAIVRGLCGHADRVRWLPHEQATEGWALETGGRVAGSEPRCRPPAAERGQTPEEPHPITAAAASRPCQPWPEAGRLGPACAEARP